MSDNSSIMKLEALKSEVLENIMSMVDQFVGDGEEGIQALLTISRNTGNVDLLSKAMDKAKTIENLDTRTDAMLAILSEIENNIAEIQFDEQQTPNDSDEK